MVFHFTSGHTDQYMRRKEETKASGEHQPPSTDRLSPRPCQAPETSLGAAFPGAICVVTQLDCAAPPQQAEIEGN